MDSNTLIAFALVLTAASGGHGPVSRFGGFDVVDSTDVGWLAFEAPAAERVEGLGALLAESRAFEEAGR